MKYNVNESAVKLRDGLAYDLGNYVKGVDYVERRCFKTFKNMFRSDILGLSVVDPSKVEHKQDSQPVFVAELEQGEHEVAEMVNKGLEQATEEQQEAVIAPQRGNPPQLVKIKKIYANFKYVETDSGRIFVGMKGSNLRVNQVIRVKDGQLYLRKV